MTPVVSDVRGPDPLVNAEANGLSNFVNIIHDHFTNGQTYMKPKDLSQRSYRSRRACARACRCGQYSRSWRSAARSLALELVRLRPAAAWLQPLPHAANRYGLWDRYKGDVWRRRASVSLHQVGARCSTVSHDRSTSWPELPGQAIASARTKSKFAHQTYLLAYGDGSRACHVGRPFYFHLRWGS